MIEDDLQYERAASGFDKVAAVYDDVYGSVGQNDAVRWMKAENWAIVLQALSGCQRVLEVGCGTGEDAVALAQLGMEVVATDISPTMVEHTHQRAVSAGPSVRVLAREATAAKLEPVLEEFGPTYFDGAYSGFALVYEPNMKAVSKHLARLIRPGGRLVVTIYSRTCLWETAWWFLHGHPWGAFRRWRCWSISQIGAGAKIPAQHYSPRRFAHFFRNDFTLQQATALSLIIPPPFLDPLYQRYINLFKNLEALERRIRSWPMVSGWGHAFVAVFKRR